MKKLAIAVVVGLIAAFGYAEALMKFGGEGKVAIVNACEVSNAALDIAAKKIGNLLMIEAEVQKGTWKLESAADDFSNTKANVAVFVISCDKLPMSLIAMESKWGVVNAKGLSEKSLEKEVLRVMTVLLGGASSKYPASTMRPVFSIEDLDKKAGEVMTFDSLMAIFPCLPELGLKQYQMMTREDAIEEGLIQE